VEYFDIFINIMVWNRRRKRKAIKMEKKDFEGFYKN
jgi:hypothetical protein